MSGLAEASGPSSSRQSQQHGASVVELVAAVLSFSVMVKDIVSWIMCNVTCDMILLLLYCRL